MRVGIIGTNWGRTHIGTFRRCGVEVHALVGTDGPAVAAIAAAEDVPIGTDDVAVLDAVDIVVIATPTPVHRQFVERFPDKAVLCEKPLLGRAADPA
ncbi:MAG: Gfo/Idh/MocA family oxidoreductase [Myxococcota bacterium]